MLMFQLKRKNADMIKPKNKRPRAVSHEDLRTTSHEHSPVSQPSKLPFLVELNQGKSQSPIDMDESFQDFSWIQDFEDDFPQKVILKMLN